MKSLLQLVLLSCILVGCSSISKSRDLDILGTESCAPPCWRGITPGVTTAEEAISLFQDWQSNNQGTWKRNTGTNNVISWDYICWSEKFFPETCMDIDSNDLISEIDLTISFSFLKLRDIIEKYGNPDGYTSELCVDCSGYGISIYYPEKGLLFTFSGSGKIQIIPTLKISRAIFFAPSNQKQVVDEIGYRPWTGYDVTDIQNNK